MELFEANYIARNKQEARGYIPRHDYNRLNFPHISDLTHYDMTSLDRLETRQFIPTVEAILSSWERYGPFITRFIASQKLYPMVTITLQRNTIDVGGNAGLLSVGELPPGVKSESLTWVPLRAYGPEQGGLMGPPDSPEERYPIAWEIPLDDVYLDGEKLPRSTLASSNISLSALVDTVRVP